MGFMTEQGPQPDVLKYLGLRAATCDYPGRSRLNVDESDATIAFRIAPSDGTDKTVAYAVTGTWYKAPRLFRLDTRMPYEPMHTTTPMRPCLVVPDTSDHTSAAEAIRAFLLKHQVRVLNICGHRASHAHHGYGKAIEDILLLVFRTLKQPQ